MVLLTFFLVACEKEEPTETVPPGKLSLRSPAAGAFVEDGETTASGLATALNDVQVNGVEATVDGGKFTAEVPLERGVNVVEATGVDGTGHKLFERNGVLAGSYTQAEGPVEDALSLRVNQSGLDRIGEIAVGAFDVQTINDMLPALNPIYTYDTGFATWISADVQSITFDNPSLDFEPRDGALGLTVTIPNLYVDLYAFGEVVYIDYDSDASMWASAAVLTADLYVDASNGKLAIDMGTVTVDLKDFGYDTSLIPGDFESYLFVDTIRGKIEEMLATQITDTVPPLLDETLNGLDPSYSTELMGLPVDMSFSFASADVDDRGLALTLDLAVDVPQSGKHSAPGYFTAPLGTPEVDEHSDLAGAVSDNLLNRMLYEAWQGGLLDMTLSTDDGSLTPLMLAPLKATEGTIKVNAKLPPVVVERDGQLQAQLGELMVDIETPGGALGDHLLASVNAFVDLTVTVKGGELTLELGTPELVLMVRESSMGADDEEMTTLVEQVLPLDLLFALLGDFSFPLPALYGIELDEGSATRDASGVYTGLEISLK